MNKHDDLIASLSRDLAPVSPAPNVNTLAIAWFLMSAIYVVAVTHLFGPIRTGAYAQLFSEPRFLLESLLGIAAIARQQQSTAAKSRFAKTCERRRAGAPAAG